MHLFQPFVGFLPVFVFLFIAEYSYKGSHFKPIRWAFFTVPFVTTLLVVSNSYHHLIWTSISFIEVSDFLSVEVSYGWWFHFHTAYSYLLIAATFYLMVDYIRKVEEVKRREASYLIASIAIPVFTNSIHMIGIIPGWNKDFSAISFGISILLLNQVMYEYYTSEIRRKVQSVMSGVL
jgi:hypothetical protein